MRPAPWPSRSLADLRSAHTHTRPCCSRAAPPHRSQQFDADGSGKIAYQELHKGLAARNRGSSQRRPQQKSG